jgi:hypothetical protein
VIEKRLQLLADGEASAVALLIEQSQVRILTLAAEAGAPDAQPLPRDSNARR